MSNFVRLSSLLLVFLLYFLSSSAQTLRIWKNGSQLYSVEVSGVDSVSFSHKVVASPELVDLGLSVKWASFNLGAAKPEETGDFYMWGETTTATERMCSWITYNYANGAENKLTKYVPEDKASEYGNDGYSDDKKILEPDDDAAHVALGGKWRMPTIEEWLELSNNCTWERTELNGVIGYKVTSRKEALKGNSIFLPINGIHIDDYFRNQDNCYYWSSSLGDSYPYHAKFFISTNAFAPAIKNYRESMDGVRSAGLTIRPVSD